MASFRPDRVLFGQGDYISGRRSSDLLITLLHGTEGCETGVLVENIDLRKPNFPEQVQLEHKRPGRVLFLDVGKDLISVGFILQLRQIFAVATTHRGLDLGNRTVDQIEYPNRSARLQSPEELRKYGSPLRFVPQVVKHGSGEDDWLKLACVLTESEAPMQRIASDGSGVGPRLRRSGLVSGILRRAAGFSTSTRDRTPSISVFQLALDASIFPR